MKRTVLLLAVLATALFLNAQTPINDEYTGALQVTPSTDASCIYTFGTTIGATQSLPGCYGSAEDDIWFKFTATSNRHRIIVTGDLINHVLELFTFSSGSLTSLACRYKTAPSDYGYLSTEFPDLIAGTTYYYRVYGAGSTSQRGQISNCITSPPLPPANDECTGAIELTVNSNNVCTSIYSGNFGNASQSLPAFVDKGSEVFDVWFKFIATATSHKIRLTHANFFPPLMEAFAGNCSNLVSLKHFAPPYQSQPQPLAGVLYNLTPGNTYYIRVYQDGSIVRPDQIINLCITSPPFETEGYKFPIVSLTSPADGAGFTAPTSVNLSATVTVGEEPIQKVEFFYSEYQRGETKLGEDLTAPYEYTWNDAFPGHYTIIAKAIDKAGATAISGSTITINPPPTNQPPTLNFSAYTLGSGFAPATVFLNGMATDVDGKIIKVELFQNGQLIFPFEGPNFSIAFSGLNPGYYSYEAKAVDDQGGVVVAYSFVIVHEPLKVSLTAPANGASFTAPATISLEAAPSGGDGTFSKVEFYHGTTKIGEDLTAPYTFNLTNVAAGTYSLTAKVFHNMGDSAVSQGIQVTVLCPSVKPVITANGALNFCNGGSVTLTSSAATNNQWYKDNVAINGATNQTYVVSAAGTYKVVHSNACGSSTSDPVTVTAVPTSVVSFTLVNSTNDLDIQSLKDGDSINLATLSSTNLSIRANSASPIGSIVFNLTGAQTVNQTESVSPYALFGDDNGDYFDWTPAVGNYTLKATPFCEAGGTGTAGTAATINFKVINKATLNISLTSPLSNNTFTAPASISLAATPSGGDGTFSKVEFYNGTTKLGEDLTAPYTFDWTNVAAGTYSLTAKVFHSMGDNATSGAISVTVTEPANQLPNISLTAPVNGASLPAPATVTLTAVASDADGSITKVEFYNGASKIGEDFTAPYQYEWIGVGAGFYSLTAKAIDNRGGVSTSTAASITILNPVNQPPIVTLIAPLVTYGPTNADPVTIFIEASAYDGDGSIAKVECYQNGMPIGVATTPPYQFFAVIMNSGPYMFTARAYDNLGAFSEMSIDVWVQRAPWVILNSPANGTTFTAPATVNLSATVDQGDAPISKVEFYNGTTKLGEDLTTPYTFNWTNVAAGTYKITARVSDEWGSSTFSPEVTFTVNEAINQLPTVTLTTPANGSSFTAPASISLTATASDVDGTISKVEFYNGATKLGEDLTAPFEFGWNGVSSGIYSLTAKAIDNRGGMSTSTAVSVTVLQPSAVTFTLVNSTNDLDIQTLKDGDSINLATLSSTNLNIRANSASSIGSMVFNLTGAQTVNQTESVSPYALFGDNSGDYNDWTPAVGTYTLKATPFSEGGGTGTAGTAATINFKVINKATNLPLSIGLTSPASGSNFTAPATINLAATPSGGDGTFSKVEFYNGTTKLGEDLTAPYTFNWTNVAAGTYSLTAKVFHSTGNNATSNPVTITVNEPANQPPTVSLTAPVSGASLPAPATVTLTAVASDVDGSITKVEFYNGASKIGEDFTAPYQYEWSGISAGTYVLTAKAIDNQGAIAASSVVSITVSEPVNQLPTVNLTSPANGASFNAPASINLTATASDADGTINKVEFYNGTTKLGEDFIAPYEYSWSGATTGNYSLSAKAIDNMGGVSSSNTASVSVVTPPAGGTLVNKNSVWKYNDKGVDLGTSWTALNYNDASWSSGPGVLGYGTPVATTLNFGNKNNKYPSYYFRRSFEITDASIYTTLVFNIRRDDGAVVYLNGVEQFRTNMPGGIVGYNSFASTDLNGPDQSNYFSFRIAASQLRAGTNVIAVSVHQSDRKSADMSFDMEVIAETRSANQLPTARIKTVDYTGSKESLEKTEKSRLLVKAIPNPSTSYFTLLLQSNRSETVDIRVVDAMGRLVETRRKLPSSATVKFGYNYRPGIYFAEVIQGTQRTTLKLIKGKD